MFKLPVAWGDLLKSRRRVSVLPAVYVYGVGIAESPKSGLVVWSGQRGKVSFLGRADPLFVFP